MAASGKTGTAKKTPKKPIVLKVLTDNGNLLKRKGRAKRK